MATISSSQDTNNTPFHRSFAQSPPPSGVKNYFVSRFTATLNSKRARLSDTVKYGAVAYAASVDREFLRTVQKTAESSDLCGVVNVVLWVLLGIIILGVGLYLLNRFYLHKNDALAPMEHFEIRDPQKIYEIFEEADARKSVMELNVPEYRYESFKCLMLDFKRNEHTILVEDPPERGPSHNFEGERVNVTFAINYRDKQKFYSFVTQSKGIIPINMRGFKRAIVLRTPQRVEIKQRRNSVRIELPLDHEFSVDLIKNKRYHGIPLDEIEFSEEIKVEDISRDGMRLSYEKGSVLETMKKGDTFAIRFFLDPTGLSLDGILQDYIYMEVEVAHNMFQRAERHFLGIRFVRRGTIKEGKLFFERLKALTNEDIHKWVTALYARQLRRERGMERVKFEYLSHDGEDEEA